MPFNLSPGCITAASAHYFADTSRKVLMIFDNSSGYWNRNP